MLQSPPNSWSKLKKIEINKAGNAKESQNAWGMDGLTLGKRGPFRKETVKELDQNK